MKYYLIIDTVSIQKYIFSSNKLKMNIGASSIVAKDVFSVSNLKDSTVIYSGGGNCLLEFTSNGCRSNFIRSYSKNMLLNYPGLRLGFGVANGDIENVKEYKRIIKDLHDDLRLCKNESFVNTIPYQPGIVAACPFTGEGMHLKIKDNDINKYVSISAASRIIAAPETEKYNEYSFPLIIEDLGQQEGKGYVAIVHIDGNGVGELFKSCTSKDQLVQLSKDVNKIVSEVNKELMEEIVQLVSNKPLLESLGIDLKPKTLPIRPLILGGDDITFVCAGTLGIFLAQRFIEIYKTMYLVIDGKVHHLNACAGISIVKSKFPFFKAYDLAESLLKKAKGCVKNEEINYPSALAYQIVGSGNIEKDREIIIPLSDLEKYLNIILHFQNKSNNWSKSKLMDYRSVIEHAIRRPEKDRMELKYFKEHAIMREINFPQSNDLQLTYNAIELQEFYPISLIKDEE